MNTHTLDVRLLAHTLLSPHPLQLRKAHAADAVMAMSDNIRERIAAGQIGIIEPLVVTPAPQGGYWIVAGQLRHAGVAALGDAAPLLPCIVRVFASDADVQAEMAAENGARRDMRPSEWAAYVAHLARTGKNRVQIAATTGRDPRWVDQMQILASLPGSIQAFVDCGELALDAAMHVAELKHEVDQVELAAAAAAKGLPARKVALVVAAMNSRGAPAATAAARVAKISTARAPKPAQVLEVFASSCARCTARPPSWKSGAPAVLAIQRAISTACARCQAQLPEVCKACPLMEAATALAVQLESGDAR